MAQTGKDLMRKVTSIQECDSWDITSTKNRATLSGGLVGMAIGVYIGYSKKQNLLVAGILGAIGGALVSKLFTPK